ncbi:putative F-box/LRR-repeat protein 9 [Silene latifolia]|uniref:putative F-box/LRR-repeat protein 9 n=1 Tax=Silene latifolia TaxID=37657 RepID=UPI003D781BA1
MSSMEISHSGDEKYGKWTELPRDVTMTILVKLGTLEILESAQFVCKFWYNLCKDPSIWRSIHFRNIDESELINKHEKMMLNALDRSATGLIDLDVEGFGSDHLCSFIASRASQLKRFRLACCHNISADALIDALRKLPSLEELELTLCSFQAEKIILIINSCPSLKTFKLNELGSRNPTLACDEEALAIAGSMPNLQHLQLIGNSLTNDGLTAILDRCPHLLSLDLRACFHLDLMGNLGKRLPEQIKDLRLPYDSTEDYNYLTTDYDSDFDEIYAEYDDMDYVSDDDHYEFSDENEPDDYDDELDDYFV